MPKLPPVPKVNPPKRRALKPKGIKGKPSPTRRKPRKNSIRTFGKLVKTVVSAPLRASNRRRKSIRNKRKNKR